MKNLTLITIIMLSSISSFSQQKSKYEKGFTFYDTQGIKVTLIKWVQVYGDLYRWKAKFAGFGVITEGWTDDCWIDVYTHKAFVNEQIHKIVYYDEVNITPKTK